MFFFTPVGLEPGSIPMRARTLSWDPDGAAFVTGTWATLNFTLEEVENQLIRVAVLKLANDTGASSVDRVTTDPLLVGQLVHADGPVAFQLVEIDTDNDEDADATVFTQWDGTFEYFPSGLEPDDYTMGARAREWDYATQQHVFGAWKKLTFTLQEDVNEVPEIAEFYLYAWPTPSGFATAPS